MTIYDAHVHLDSYQHKNALSAAEALNQQLIAADIEKAIVLHLEVQQWPLADINAIIQKYPRIEAFVNIHPDSKNACEQLINVMKNMQFCGLKLHPRLQQFELASHNVIKLCQQAGTLNIPVLIDAFPDGTGLMHGFNPLDYAQLAKNCPDTRFIWAHMGGHYVIDMMMLAKRLENVYFDCSFSLLYFRGSSIPQNMVYAMNSMRFERIFYGSDYPDRSIKKSLEESIVELKSLKVNEQQLEKLLYKNLKDFMQW